jgi:anaerobic selenocysteine-containing dehydrogenase
LPVTVPKTCNLCEATCGVLVEVEKNRVVSIRPDRQDAFSRGHICPKAIALKEVQEDPDRLLKPLRRRGSDWEEVSWDEALVEAAGRLVEVQRRHGRNAVATYLGNPVVHNSGAALYSQVLLRAIRSRSRMSAGSVDQNPKHASSLFLFGNILNIPVPDLERTRFLLILGANPVVSNGSLMTAPDVRRRLAEIRRRGGRIVVVDPRRTETAALADQHLPLRPGQDALLLAALVHTVLAEDLGHLGAAAGRVTHLEALRRQVALFSPEAVARPTGIEAPVIRELARDFAAADAAACYGRTGTCLQEYGTLASWLVDVLNLVTGNLDRPGGVLFPTPALDLAAFAGRHGRAGHLALWRSRVRGAPEFNGELPVACLAEEILTPGEGQIRALLTIAGNPVLSTPNGRELDRALSTLDFFCAVDLYVNETTRHAHLILPPTWSLEHDNFEVAFHQFAIRNTVKYSPAVLEPPPGAKHEWEILGELTLRILEAKRDGAKRALWRFVRGRGLLPSPRTVLDFFLRTGPRGDKYLPWRKGLSLRALERNPHGIDLGPLEPSIPQRLPKPIDLGHPLMMAELSHLAARAADLGTIPEGELLLIGRRDLRSNNSWCHNTRTLVKDGPRCQLLMHPQDAHRLGLRDGQEVRVRSRVGEVVTPLRISEEMMPGVVSLPHGWGHGREGVRLSVASRNAGVSVNDLTDEQVLERVVGNAVLNGVPVVVSSAETPPL